LSIADTALYRPIKSNDYLREITDGKIVVDHEVGIKSDGSPVFIVRQVLRKRVGKNVKLTPGPYLGYNITDLLSATGAILVNQGTNPWIITVASGGRGQGIAQVFGADATANNILGGVAGNNATWNVKSALLSTGGAGGSRGPLKVAGNIVASKVVPAGTNGDLLDHELVVSGNQQLTIPNAEAGDILNITAVQIA